MLCPSFTTLVSAWGVSSTSLGKVQQVGMGYGLKWKSARRRRGAWSLLTRYAKRFLAPKCDDITLVFSLWVAGQETGPKYL